MLGPCSRLLRQLCRDWHLRAGADFGVLKLHENRYTSRSVTSRNVFYTSVLIHLLHIHDIVNIPNNVNNDLQVCNDVL